MYALVTVIVVAVVAMAVISMAATAVTVIPMTSASAMAVSTMTDSTVVAIRQFWINRVITSCDGTADLDDYECRKEYDTPQHLYL